MDDAKIIWLNDEMVNAACLACRDIYGVGELSVNAVNWTEFWGIF